MPPSHAGVSATVVMPTTTPMLKVNNTKDYGAKVILHGSTFDDAAAKAMELAESEGMTYIPPFNDLTVATGQGTIAYEIFRNLPDVDVILVPIGGGGLASGVVHPGQAAQPQCEGHRRGAHRRSLHEGLRGSGPCGHPGHRRPPSPTAWP